MTRRFRADVYTRLEAPRKSMAQAMAEVARVLELPPEERPAMVPPVLLGPAPPEREPDDLPF